MPLEIAEVLSLYNGQFLALNWNGVFCQFLEIASPAASKLVSLSQTLYLTDNAGKEEHTILQLVA